ncbi:hypothetical protein QAD02_020174 [Eretmocerus hayati]|uniref:Uncharacterized protein n=1 Tax=Eretmocerus hayati TaxID=131215 RepID=A0ACC2PLW6_9HYME|nr:hypothetical protein QAD02_020174 [Eretmocerus hayati]
MKGKFLSKNFSTLVWTDKATAALVILGLACCAAAPAESETPATPVVSQPFKPQCPEVDDVFVTLIGNPDKCTTYFVCDRGIPVTMNCPAGLHFNDNEKACDWPHKACCDVSLDVEQKCV